MAEEKKETTGTGERGLTVQIEGCGACCGSEAAGLKSDGKPRVIKVICCPSEEKKAE